MPTLIDLFAGCGGMTQGFAATGFRSVDAVEWDLAAAATYAANFGEEHVFWGDIAEFLHVRRADVVIGGPPCQGFSSLGSKDPDDPRNSLWREYMRVVLEANPQVFVLENVDRFKRSPEYELLMSELAGGRLRRWKWHDVGVLNAADYGVPQRRQRTILIASRVGPIALPNATHGRVPGLGEARWVPVSEKLADVPVEPTSTRLPDSAVTIFGQTVPGTFKMRDIHLGRQPSPLSLERYDLIPPGGGRFDLPERLLPNCWKNKPTGTSDVMGRLRWDRPSVTIRTEFFKPEKGRYLHPQWDSEDRSNRVNRSITHQEAALLQTFPESFLWCGSKVQIARQIGNAVPPLLAKRIAETVADRLK